MDNSSYQLLRYYERRAAAVEQLGGVCVICGTDEDLQIDHIFRSEKEFNISQMWSMSEEKYKKELAKCQLLCGVCHRAKSAWEIGAKAGKTHHGTLTSYRYCKCDECRAAYQKYWEEYKQFKVRDSAKPSRIRNQRKGGNE